MLLSLLAGVALADSPITSIDLSVGFPESEGVRLAKASWATPSAALVDYLLGDHALAERIAVVDAMGWEGDGRALAVLGGIAAKRDKQVTDLTLADVQPGERVLLGYLLAHDDYFELGPMKPGARDDLFGASAMALASSGANSLRDDFAAQAVVAMIDAQHKTNGSWCAVWTTWRTLLERFPESRRNLPAASVAHATDYLQLYAKHCGPDPMAPPSPQLDQVYALARLGSRLFAGTQGGMVVWRDDRVDSLRPEKICNSLAVVGDAVYAGCYHRLLRWREGAWTTVDYDGEVREGGSYAVWTDPAGKLRVQRGDRELMLTDEGLLAPTGSAPGYDRLYAPDGTVWSIDFLSAVVRDGERIPLRSEVYPGSDPRRFRRDGRGRIWVVDFESGFFLWDPARARFQPVDGVSSKGSDIGVREPGGAVWMLHYTDGLVIQPPDGPLERIDLSAQEYMRALLVEEDVVWVGGWHGIVKIRRGEQGWARKTLRASSPSGG